MPSRRSSPGTQAPRSREQRSQADEVADCKLVLSPPVRVVARPGAMALPVPFLIPAIGTPTFEAARDAPSFEAIVRARLLASRSAAAQHGPAAPSGLPTRATERRRSLSPRRRPTADGLGNDIGRAGLSPDDRRIGEESSSRRRETSPSALRHPQASDPSARPDRRSARLPSPRPPGAIQRYFRGTGAASFRTSTDFFAFCDSTRPVDTLWGASVTQHSRLTRQTGAR